MSAATKEKGAAVNAAAEGNKLTVARDDQTATVSAEEEGYNVYRYTKTNIYMYKERYTKATYTKQGIHNYTAKLWP